MGGTCNTHRINAYSILLGRPEGKRSIGRRVDERIILNGF
jgi:hypothetical protein